MLRVGLTGGMGAGKSTVARVLAECGAVIVDSDAIAREVVAPGTPGLASLVAAFGVDILASDGGLDRPALAAKAFANDESRSMLNSITHPLVGVRTMELLAAAPADAVVVQDIPLLIENGMAPMFHLVIAVHADVEERVTRLVTHRGVDESDARARIAAQATDEQRRVAADVLLDNGGAPGSMDVEVRRLYRDRLVPFERNVRERHRAGANHWLVPYDSRWFAQAQRLVARLSLLCGADALRIDHVGSTAVPGLEARDVLDVQIVVADLGVADGLADRLADAGFPRISHAAADKPIPGFDGSWEKRSHGSADPARPATISLRVAGSPGERFTLALLKWLRADPQARAEYSAVKHEAEAKATGLAGHDAAVAYLSVKHPWFAEVGPRVAGHGTVGR